MNGTIRAMSIPYANFKHRIKITKKYEKKYHIENLGGYLYMVRRERHC